MVGKLAVKFTDAEHKKLSELVFTMKKRGHRYANKSWLLREALKQLDIDKLPPPIREL